MSQDAIRMLADAIDLRTRVVQSTTVVASPAAAAETIIAQVQPSGLAAIETGVILIADAAYTVGTNGTAVTFKIRQTNVSGATVRSTGALTGGIAAANLLDQDLIAFDASPASPVSLYVFTMQVTAGSASSTVSAVTLIAITV